MHPKSSSQSYTKHLENILPSKDTFTRAFTKDGIHIQQQFDSKLVAKLLRTKLSRKDSSICIKFLQATAIIIVNLLFCKPIEENATVIEFELDCDEIVS